MEQPVTTELNKEDIMRATTNAPTENAVVLSGRSFPLYDLPYDDYFSFLVKLQPLLESVVGKLTSFKGVDVPETAFNVGGVLQYCGEALPELVQIVCKQSDPTITINEIKRLAGNPFRMASVVLAQIQQNRMISDFADFFGQILPLVSMMKTPDVDEKPNKRSKTKATL